MSNKFTVDDWIKKGINESDYKKSIEFFDEALFLDPYNQNALYNKGIVHLQYKQYQDAYNTFKFLTKLNKKHSEAWYSMGLACEMCNDTVPAKKFYRKAVYLDSHHIDAIYGLIRLDKKNELRTFCLKKITEAMPEDIDSWIELIELKIQNNELSSAQKYLSDATIHHPTNRKLSVFKERLDKKLLERTNENKIKKPKTGSVETLSSNFH